MGLCWLVLILLLVHWWPGPLERWPMILIYAGGALLLLLGLLWHKPLPLRPTGAATWVWVLALVALAVLLRLPGLEYHEFHDDEVAVLTRAREAFRGMDDALERHTKGPGEFAVAGPRCDGGRVRRRGQPIPRRTSCPYNRPPPT